MTYRERPTVLPGVVLWSRTGTGGTARILPDGCMDLVWSGAGLTVAGPDTAARSFTDTHASRHVGLRFARGLGPRLLGVSGNAVRDSSPTLAAVWGDRRAAALVARADDDPEGALTAWLAACATSTDVGTDPFGTRVFTGLDAGLSVAAVADRLGVTPRTLHRRCLPVFGYGPQHLARVLRLQRALDAARRGRPWAEVAASTGYADQPHLAREARALAGATPSTLLVEHR